MSIIKSKIKDVATFGSIIAYLTEDELYVTNGNIEFTMSISHYRLLNKTHKSFCEFAEPEWEGY